MRPLFSAVDKVKGVEAYAPCYPIPREEKWYFLLCDTPHNVLLAHANAMLMEAEKEGAVNSEKYLGVGSLLPKIKGKEPSKVDAAAYKVGIKAFTTQ